MRWPKFLRVRPFVWPWHHADPIGSLNHGVQSQVGGPPGRGGTPDGGKIVYDGNGYPFILGTDNGNEAGKIRCGGTLGRNGFGVEKPSAPPTPKGGVPCDLRWQGGSKKL